MSLKNYLMAHNVFNPDKNSEARLKEYSDLVAERDRMRKALTDILNAPTRHDARVIAFNTLNNL